MYQDFYERINLNTKLEDLSKMLCKKYELGEYVSDQLILVGYEDFNYILTTSTGKYCVKVFNKERTDNDVSNYIDRIELASTLDINTPKVYKVNDKSLQSLEINGNQYKLCVFEYIDGKSFYDLNEIPTDFEIKEIIRQMVKIHNTKLTSDFIYDKWTITNFIKEYKNKKNSLSDHTLYIFDKLVNRLGKVDFTK